MAWGCLVTALQLAAEHAYRAERARMTAITRPRTPEGRRHRARLLRLAEHHQRQAERLLLGGSRRRQ